jgi:hypothetical protein
MKEGHIERSNAMKLYTVLRNKLRKVVNYIPVKIIALSNVAIAEPDITITESNSLSFESPDSDFQQPGEDFNDYIVRVEIAREVEAEKNNGAFDREEEEEKNSGAFNGLEEEKNSVAYESDDSF